MAGNELTITIVQEGSRILANYLRSRPIRIKDAEYISQEIPEASPSLSSEKPSYKVPQASSIKSGCIPCSLGHFGTCSGLLNEAVRFARKDGMGAEVSNRINNCLDELNALERVDLRPEMITQLTGWERELSQQALAASRGTRHSLEAIMTADDLEIVAAETQKIRNEMGKEWFTHKWAELTPEQQTRVKKEMQEKAQRERNNAPVPAA